MTKLSVYLATIFGIGYFPFAPGTMGTVFAFLIYYILPESFFKTNYDNFIVLIILIGLSFVGVAIISKAEEYLGHDDGRIIIDEFVGYFIAILFLPKSLLLAILAFIFFRVFDITKPQPINKLQNLPKGWGIMTDDIVAGIFSNICLQIIIKIYPKIF